jgi:alcohol dehydrogenase (cytochrome c)
MTQPARRQPFALSVLLGAILLSGQAMAAVTDQDILQDPKNPEQIVTNGLGVQGQRYSPLDTLNVDNVKDLRPVWAFSFGGEKQRGQQAQPMIKDGVMYLTGSYSRVFAVDARTGKKLWQYDARLPDDIRPCCDVINRGVALYGDLVFFGTLDAKLVALNKDTGKVVWSKQVADHKEGYSISAAPLVINGKLITGVAGGEFGVVGKIQAYDPKNGELLWMRPTVEGHMGYVYKDGKAVENGISGGEAGKTWPATCGRPAARRPGWAVTTTRKPTCCSAPATRRRGTRTCAPATTCIPRRAWRSTRTTASKWHFQSTPHDGWDFDGVNELISFNYKDGGKEIKAAATADRNGFFYVLDRTNGKFIRGFPFVDKITWATGLDKDGRPIYNEASRPGAPGSEPRAARCSSPRPSSARRTGCRWPTTGHRAVLRAVQRVGHGHLERRHRLQERRGVPRPASPSSRSTKTTSACCAPSTRRPARKSGATRTTRRCGAGC